MPRVNIGRIVGLGVVAVVVLAVLSLLGCQSAPSAPAAPTQAPASQTKPSAPTQAPAAAPTQAAAPAATQAPAAAPTQAAAVQTIKVGLQIAMSGSYLQSGRASDRYMRMSIDDINAKGVHVGGKTYRFEPVTVDDKGTPDEGASAAKRLVLQENIKFTMGTSSTAVAGAQPITEPAKVLMLSSNALDANMGPAHPFQFYFLSMLQMRAGAVYDWLVKEHPEVKTVAVLSADDAAGMGGKLGLDAAAAHNITVVAKELYPLDTKDFNPLVTRLLRQKPDAIDLGGAARGMVSIGLTKALSEQGFKGPIFALSVEGPALSQIAPWSEGFTVSLLADRNSPSVLSGEKAVLDRYVQKFGEPELEPVIVTSFNEPWVLAQAMEKAGTVDDTLKIAETLRAGEWDTIWSKEFGKTHFSGAKTYGLNVVPEQPIYMSGVRNGKVTTFSAIKGIMP